MDKFGPLRHHACFCCEAKNFLIKKFDYKSFKNICFSAADKHQFWMASKENEQSNKNSLKYVDDVCTVDKNKIVDSSILVKLNIKSCVNAVKVLKLNGFRYIPGCFLILELNLNIGMVSIGLIKEIFVVDGCFYYFNLQMCTIDKKHPNLNCLYLNRNPNLNRIQDD
jgi:hypothetical protein